MLKTDAKSADDIASVGQKSVDENLAGAGNVPRQSIPGYEPLVGRETPANLGWSGAGHIEESTPEAEAAYAAIRANTGDVAKIADNTGFDQDLIAQVKDHLFLTEHDVPVGPNQVAHGYFTADEDLASLWNKAEEGPLNPSEKERLRSLVAHEYVESRLMNAGMPYRSADPAGWKDGTLTFDPSHFGAHEVAPLSSDGSLRLWPKLGLTPPDTPIAPDLSNLDDVVEAALRGLSQ
jgi:hypothetical protein